MDSFILKAIDYAKNKTDYCDIRAISTNSEIISKSSKEESCAFASNYGVGVRILKNGVYGYTSCNDKNYESIKNAIDNALKIAKTNYQNNKNRAVQAEYPGIIDEKKTPVKINPFEISLEDKKNILEEAHKNANLKGIAFTQEQIRIKQTDKHFVNTEGSQIKTQITNTTLSLMSVAKKNGLNTMNYDVYAKPAGFETINNLDIGNFASSISKKAISFLDAGKTPKGKMDVIMSPQVAGTLVHEVFGHAAEADWIANGRSLLKNKLNQQMGSEMLSIYDDGSMNGGWGTVYYDDEGIPAKKTVLLDKGVLVQYMHSRETAAKLGMELTGNGRAQDHTHRIIPRMTNTCLKTGDFDISEMISGVKNGILVDKYTSALEDPAGGSFELKTLGGHIIQNGELKKPIERATISSSSFIDTFMNVRALSKKTNLMNVGSCGKGHGDWVPVGNPSPAILLSDLIVGGN